MDLRSKIFGSLDRPSEKVHCPEWGVDLWVRTMGSEERDAWERSLRSHEGNGKSVSPDHNIRARLLVRCVCDEGGALVFSDDDAEELGRKSSLVVSRLFDVAARLNGILSADVEELEKNSEKAPEGDSSSTSASPSAAPTPTSSPSPPAKSPSGSLSGVSNLWGR